MYGMPGSHSGTFWDDTKPSST